MWLSSEEEVHFALTSNCSRAGTVPKAAWLVLGTDSELATGRMAKVSVLSWRSSRLRRVVSSTSAGETRS